MERKVVGCVCGGGEGGGGGEGRVSCVGILGSRWVSGARLDYGAQGWEVGVRDEGLVPELKCQLDDVVKAQLMVGGRGR